MNKLPRSLEYDLVMTARRLNKEPKLLCFDGQVAWLRLTAIK